MHKRELTVEVQRDICVLFLNRPRTIRSLDRFQNEGNVSSLDFQVLNFICMINVNQVSIEVKTRSKIGISRVA